MIRLFSILVIFCTIAGCVESAPSQSEDPSLLIRPTHITFNEVNEFIFVFSSGGNYDLRLILARKIDDSIRAGEHQEMGYLIGTVQVFYNTSLEYKVDFNRPLKKGYLGGSLTVFHVPRDLKSGREYKLKLSINTSPGGFEADLEDTKLSLVKLPKWLR